MSAPGDGELSGRSREGGIFGSAARGLLVLRGGRALFAGGSCAGANAAGRSGGGAILAAAVGSAPLAASVARTPFAGFGCRRERVSSVESLNGPLPRSEGKRVHAAATVNGPAAASAIGW